MIFDGKSEKLFLGKHPRSNTAKLVQVYVVENFMKSSNRNRIKGAAKELKGRVKHAAGRATRNRRLQRQGRAEAAAGRARRRVGQAQQDLEAITQRY